MNQNIWANGDVTQIFDNDAIVASGDGAIAAGGSVAYNSFNEDDHSTNIEDSFNDDHSDNSDNSVNTAISDSFNDNSNQGNDYSDNSDNSTNDSFNDNSDNSDN